jgi:hypothetical protein
VDEIGRVDPALAGLNFIMLQDEKNFVPPGEYRSPLKTSYDTLDAKYNVNISRFLQDLYAGYFHSVSEPYVEEQAQVYFFGESNVNTPQSSTSHLVTTTLAVPKDSIRLKIHYTIPTVENQ